MQIRMTRRNTLRTIAAVAASVLNAPDAAQSFFFADTVHPTSGGHAQFGRYVIDRISAAIPR